jgi:hypothetical protein
LRTFACMTSSTPLADGCGAAGLSFEDRQDLLGHGSRRITTHYSAADLSRLIEAAESVCERDGKRLELVVLRGPAKLTHRPLAERLGRIQVQ